MVEERAAPVPWGQVLAVLALAGAFMTIVRVRGEAEPLDPDVVTYATIGHELVMGRRLYTDVWDVKPPGLYETFAIGEKIAGRGTPAVFLLGWVAAIATLAAAFLAGRARGWEAGLVAAVVWAVLSETIALEANQPNSEVFINALSAAGFAALVTAPPERSGWARALAFGATFALASTFKQVAVFPALFLGLAHWACPPDGVARRTAFAQACAAGACFVAVWSAIFAFAKISGQLALYWSTTVSVNGARTSGVLFNLYRYFREGKFFPPKMVFLLPLAVAIAAGMVCAARAAVRTDVADVADVKRTLGPSAGRSLYRPWVLLAAWALGVHFMIFAQGGRFHPHSYQFWLPVLAVGGGWVFAAAATPGAPWRRARLGFVLFAFAVILAHELPMQLRSPLEWARAKYGDTVVEDRTLAGTIGNLLRPEETVFQFGDGAAIYFYTGLRPSTPTLWTSHLLGDGPLATELTTRTLAALVAHPPDLFLLQNPTEWTPPGLSETHRGLAAQVLGGDANRTVAFDRHPIYLWAMANYQLAPASLGLQSSHMKVFVRRDSALARRLPPQ